MSEVLFYMGSRDGVPVVPAAEASVASASGYVEVEAAADGGTGGGTEQQTTGQHVVLRRGGGLAPAQWTAAAAAGDGEVRRVYGRRQAWSNDGRDRPELGSSYLLATWWSLQDDGRAQFDEWYEQEHVPLLLRVPGRSSITRYALLAGDGQDHFALHELVGPEVLDHPLERQAAATPWRERAIVGRRDFERRLYRAVEWPPTSTPDG